MPISQINTNSISSSTGLTTPTFSGNTNMTGGAKYQVGGVTTNAIAWVNFNGSTAAIRTSYNVSSVTRTGTGIYTITFSTATTDANYVLSSSATNYGGTGYLSVLGPTTTQTTSAVQITVANFSGTNTDVAYVTAAIFGN